MNADTGSLFETGKKEREKKKVSTVRYGLRLYVIGTISDRWVSQRRMFDTVRTYPQIY